MTTPPFLDNFSNNDIADVLISGSITSTIDAYGNLNLIANSTEISSSLIGFPLEKKIYDPTYIKLYYDNTITEFVTTSSVVNQISSSSAVTSLQNEVQQLQIQLNQVNANYDSVVQQNTQIGALQAEQSASRALAIGLRIQLGQGSSSADFSPSYPWLPINKATS